MFNKLWTYLQFGNYFSSIELTKKNGEEIIYGTVLKKSKKELSIKVCFETRNIKQVSKHLNQNQHTVLIVNNDQVLSKFIESEQPDVLKLVYSAFPNINIDDFYFEVLSKDNVHFITLCRKAYIDKLIENCSKNKVYVIDISFGHNGINTILPFLNHPYIHTSNSRVDLKNGFISKIEKDNIIQENYNINGLSISNKFLLSCANALGIVLNTNDDKKNNYTQSKELWLNEYKHTRFYNIFFKAGGLFILMLLLLNFFVFNYYFNKVEELNQISQINNSTKSQIIELTEIVSKKQRTVDDILKSNTSKSSFYTDVIINSLPNNILLSEFNYQPLSKRIKKDKPIELQKNIILISGSSNDSEIFSLWVSSLEEKDWIKVIDIISYGTISQSISEFQIKIRLLNE